MAEKDKQILTLKKSVGKEESKGETRESSKCDHDEDEIFESLQDSATIDYLRNVFVKYLIYLARKSEKETKTLEKVLFTVLNIPPEQEARVEKARKKSKFWRSIRWFKKANAKNRGKDLEGLDDETMLSKDLNFTMNTESDFSSLPGLIEPISIPSRKKVRNQKKAQKPDHPRSQE